MESIEIITALSYFVLGTIIGSFLNVVALRFNTGKLFFGRSECFSCGRKLQWFELIPIFSFLVLSGRCKSCKSEISLQYIFIELFTGFIFLWIFLKFSDLLYISVVHLMAITGYFIAIFATLIIIFIYDLKHKIIPDDLVYAFISLSFFTMFFDLTKIQATIPTLLHLAAGPMLFLPFFLLWFISRGKWIGLGDGKLALGIGWLLGISLGGSAIMLAFFLAAVISVAFIEISSLYLQKKRLTMKSEVPFGPFLIVGLFLAFFFNINIFNFII